MVSIIIAGLGHGVLVLLVGVALRVGVERADPLLCPGGCEVTVEPAGQLGVVPGAQAETSHARRLACLVADHKGGGGVGLPGGATISSPPLLLRKRAGIVTHTGGGEPGPGCGFCAADWDLGW